ncbi:hypothetical protein NONO_c11330 [Nocardia nova SH22a]|uniref:DUF8176 domain-containing protein n=1 Tax=Nocardia nova SH22a TaxID=1415166 RepID=W5T9E3_9NOCA|nr:hypothetical protein [Nocardia nova]AHH15940.1 hypothetical protein NONO_c11330 [Nocardia nova SH22a]
MASGDDQSRDEGDSEFGPPVSGFGPPLNDFGPPTGDFGPPTGDSAGVGWSPVGEPERPTIGWQPADTPAAPPVPPPPPQYRAPDSSTAPDASPETRRMSAPDQARGADSGRSPETVRFADAKSRGPDSGDGSWWNADDSGFPPTPPREQPKPRDKPSSLWDDDELAKKLAAPRATSEPKAGSGSLWDDDELAKKLAPSRPAPGPESEEHHRNRGVLFGGIGAAVVLVVALVLVIVFATRGGDGPSPAPAPASTAADGSCVARTEGPIVYGNGPGDTTSGANAILGYEHAYYTERSAEKAHTFVAPDANVQPVPELQKTIAEHVPVGTTYCLRIASAGPNQYSVEVTEHHPDGPAAVYLELIATVNQGGRYLIQLIQ